MSQQTCIRALVVTVEIEEMLSRLELLSVGPSIISGSYIKNRSDSQCETFPRQSWDMKPVNVRPKQRPHAHQVKKIRALRKGCIGAPCRALAPHAPL
jgi:hypothetical protein